MVLGKWMTVNSDKYDMYGQFNNSRLDGGFEKILKGLYRGSITYFPLTCFSHSNLAISRKNTTKNKPSSFMVALSVEAPANTKIAFLPHSLLISCCFTVEHWSKIVAARKIYLSLTLCPEVYCHRVLFSRSKCFGLLNFAVQVFVEQ